MLVRVYPDTNIALHCKPFQDLDWCELADSNDVTIVITSVFLREIDKHKDSSRGVIQGRARRVAGDLGERRRSKRWDVRTNVRLAVEPSEPDLAVDLSEHGLSAESNDDRLVACMIRDRSRFLDARLVCFTNDNTLAFKAADHGFAVVEPGETELLPPEPDAVERENRELRRKIAEIEARANPQPRLTLAFEGGAGHTVVKLGALRKVDDAELELLLEAERSRIEFQARIMGVMYERPSEKSITRHLDQMRTWLHAHEVAERQRLLTFSLPILLRNDGDGNADDIDVELRFEAPVSIATRRQIKRTERPKPPESRRLFIERELVVHPRFPGLDFAKLRLPALDVGPKLEIDATVARVRIGDLKHHTTRPLPRFDIWFESPDLVSSGMQIRFRIHASSPNIEEGILHVKLDIGERGLSLDAPRGDDEDDDDDE